MSTRILELGQYVPLLKFCAIWGKMSWGKMSFGNFVFWGKMSWGKMSPKSAFTTKHQLCKYFLFVSCIYYVVSVSFVIFRFSVSRIPAHVFQLAREGNSSWRYL